jgi:hypothetical protein
MRKQQCLGSHAAAHWVHDPWSCVVVEDEMRGACQWQLEK